MKMTISVKSPHTLSGSIGNGKIQKIIMQCCILLEAVPIGESGFGLLAKHPTNEWLVGIKKISFVAIPNNDLTMSMWQEAYNKSCLSVDACVRAIQGEELEAFTDTGTSIVNPNSSTA